MHGILHVKTIEKHGFPTFTEVSWCVFKFNSLKHFYEPIKVIQMISARFQERIPFISYILQLVRQHERVKYNTSSGILDVIR